MGAPSTTSLHDPLIPEHDAAFCQCSCMQLPYQINQQRFYSSPMYAELSDITFTRCTPRVNNGWTVKSVQARHFLDLVRFHQRILYVRDRFARQNSTATSVEAIAKNLPQYFFFRLHATRIRSKSRHFWRVRSHTYGSDRTTRLHMRIVVGNSSFSKQKKRPNKCWYMTKLKPLNIYSNYLRIYML